MPTFIKTLFFFFSVLLGISNVYAYTINKPEWAEFTKERVIYQRIQQLLAQNPSPQTLLLVKQMARQIPQYPLQPYIQYQILYYDNQINTLKIDQFQKTYSNFPLVKQGVDNLISQWRKNAYQNQNWETLIQLGDSSQVEERCYFLTATLKTLPKSTALFSKIENLWLSGKSLPQACDEVLTFWQGEKMTLAHLEQRAKLALKQNNLGLLRYLSNLVTNLEVDDSSQQEFQKSLLAWLQQTQRLLNHPHQLAQFVEQQEYSPRNQQLVLQLFPRYVATLTENEFLTAQAPMVLWDRWAEKFQLSSLQRQQWQRLLVQHFFDSSNPVIQRWRDDTLLQLQQDTLFERRLRLAMRYQQDWQVWLKQLSSTALQKDEWQYWYAKSLITQHRSLEAKQILQKLADKRGFFAMLAAKNLKQTYQPKLKTFKPVSMEALQKWISDHQKTLLQLAEFRFWQQWEQAEQLWQILLSQSNFEQKLMLSRYATQQHWFDFAVDATIQAKAWDYVELRLPLAYQLGFELNLENKAIRKSFAMAIARQESAWHPRVVSSANAQGLMQLLPTTAKQTAQDFQLPYLSLQDPFFNIMLGTAHLESLSQKYQNNRVLMAAAYNAGATRVDRWLAQNQQVLSLDEFVTTIPFYETRGYVQNVLTYDYFYQQLLGEKHPRMFTTQEWQYQY